MINNVDVTNVTTGTATINTTYTNTTTWSNIVWEKIGRIIIVSMYEIAPKAVETNSDAIFATCLPKPTGSRYTTIVPHRTNTNSNGYRVGIDNSGALHWSYNGASSTITASGQLIYICRIMYYI